MKNNIIILSLFLSACAGPRGDSGERGTDGLNGLPGLNGSDGQGCTVTQLDNGALVTCTNGSTLILNGEDAPATECHYKPKDKGNDK